MTNVQLAHLLKLPTHFNGNVVLYFLKINLFIAKSQPYYKYTHFRYVLYRRLLAEIEFVGSVRSWLKQKGPSRSDLNGPLNSPANTP